ncbi:hypothetical protein J3F83DRAFT_754070 [Trichoderma novae-zelandiae]
MRIGVIDIHIFCQRVFFFSSFLSPFFSCPFSSLFSSYLLRWGGLLVMASSFGLPPNLSPLFFSPFPLFPTPS